MRRTWVKVLCMLLLLLLLSVGTASGILAGMWYTNEYGSSFYDGTVCHWIMNDQFNLLYDVARIYGTGQDSQFSKLQAEEILETLSEDNSNLRYVFTNEAGTVLFSNVDPSSDWEREVYIPYNRSLTFSGERFTLYYGVLAPLSVDDDYACWEGIYDWLENNPGWVIAAIGGIFLLALLLVIALMCGAGRRAGRDGVVLNPFDRIPYDLYLTVFILLGIFCLHLVFEGYYDSILFALAGGTALVILVLAFLLTTATRVKSHTLLRNTVIFRLGRWAVHTVRQVFHSLPMVWRAIMLFIVYWIAAVVTVILFGIGLNEFHYGGWAVLLTFWMGISIPALHGFVLFSVCRWVVQWKRMRRATQSIVAGESDVKIPTAGLYADLREHAQQLNDLGTAIDNAVEDRLKSERFKAELITNVSHDLKTPLTSIINYVDLLKKEDIPNPTAREYIDVLDRKSQRLKKLTEDLVEASKASTGSLTVNKERLDVVQLARQAVGEYEEKLARSGLTPVVILPENPLHILADGRHVWRVLDNLLSNCSKYALEGTRVYLSAEKRGDRAVITVKNISRQSLNIPSWQLMDRFVRGDESRTTEGSGLGLSIARSLTELQGGEFLLEIDGDLFKAVVELPLDQSEPVIPQEN